jgi:hypothetical protein
MPGIKPGMTRESPVFEGRARRIKMEQCGASHLRRLAAYMDCTRWGDIELSPCPGIILVPHGRGVLGAEIITIRRR